MKNPLISVLLPVYNAEKYIKKAVESILNQSFKDFELIMINDGSTDNSLEIISEYARQDNRVIIITRENKGLIKSLNEGINISKGDLIARMDADDICLYNRFESQVKYLKNNPDCAAVGTFSILIDSDGNQLCAFGKHTQHDAIDKAHLKGLGGAIIHPTALIRQNYLKQLNGYSEEYPDAEDIDLWLRLAELGKLANIPENLLYYRQHVESVGYAKRESQIKSAQKAVYDAHVRRNLNLDSINLSLNKVVLPTQIDIHLKWGWWAMHGKNIETARKYAIKVLKSMPWNKEAWKLLLCSYRGY